jgi:predicted helicase
LKERTVKWINDDYVKFIRISQHQISKSKFGIIGMITNNGYFDNPTFRGVRESLMHTFSSISIIDLHGSANKKEKTPDGSKDQNVFDIRTGVGIGIFSKIENSKNLQVKHCDIWGLRESKYDQLAAISSENDVSSEITPDDEFLLFTPVDKVLSKEFDCGIKITEIMPLHGAGMTTARDKFAIDKSKEDLAKRIEAFGKSIGTNEEVCEKFSIKLKKGWDCSKARFQLGSIKDYDQYIREVSYRPFDTRYIFYHDSAVWRTVKKIMPHMYYPNLAFAVSRSVRGAPWRDVLVTKNMMEFGYIATRPGNTAPLFPMFVYDLKDLNSTKRKYNFKPNLLNSLNSHLSHKVECEELFYYIYSILNSNVYRHKYSEFIAIDFPKIPFTNDLSLFSKLSNLGKKLTVIQLMKGIEPSVKLVFKGEGDYQVGTMSEKSLKDGRLYINDTQYFDGVSESLYDYHIGSYRICHKWLKDRKGETLSKNDIIHYRKMMSVIEQSKSLVDEIDNLITKNGGFPLLGSLDFEYDDSLPDGQQKLF